MSKKALVISGGGSKGAYAVGVVDHLVRQLGLRFDVLSGTSTGALIVPIVVLEDLDLLVQRYTSVRTEDVLERRNLADALVRLSALNGTRPIARILQNDITEARARKILDANAQMFLTTVNLQTGDLVYFQTGPPAAPDPETTVIAIKDRDMLLRAILASASQPVFMPPVEIPKGSRPIRQYVDGGVREVAPLKIALDQGATELYVIVLSAKNKKEKGKAESTLQILADTINLFVSEVLLNDVQTATRRNEALHYLDAVRRRVRDRFGADESTLRDVFNPPGVDNPFADDVPVTIHLIQPETEAEIPLSSLTFDPEEMRKMVERGRKKAREMFGDAPPVVV